MSDDKRKSNAELIRSFRIAGSLIFMAALIVIAIVGTFGFLRPERSELEKRELEHFPEFNTADMLDGSYFNKLSLWYSDTFPMRDLLVSADRSIKSVYGFESKTMIVGGFVIADDIPDAPKTQNKPKPDAVASSGSAQKEDEKETIIKDEELDKDSVSEIPEAGNMDEEFRKYLQENLYVKNGAAYGLYYFLKGPADTYTHSLERAASKLDGTKVYSILVPNNSAVMLSEEELKGLGGSDEAKAIEYYESRFEKVRLINILEKLRSHNDEYIYFRTDHHWTQLGAYYAYESFCEEKGVEPIPLSEREEMVFEGFLGSYYRTLESREMEKNPDTLHAYIPIGINRMKYYDENNKEVEWYIVTNVKNWDHTALYNTFIAGDEPLEIIENPNINDGSSCVILKESYGNAFVPLLVDHYQTIYVMDYRYVQFNVLDFCKKNNIDDLICINNLTIIGSQTVADRIGILLY